MGSWSEADMITQLPINYADKVRVFVLYNQSCQKAERGWFGGGGTCYSTDIWVPLGPGLRGKYNDYGGIEDSIEDLGSKIVLEQLKEGWEPPARHKWQKEYPPIETVVLEDAISVIERGGAFLKNRSMPRAELGLTFILEDIYQDIMTYNPVDLYFVSGTYRYMKYSESIDINFKEWYEYQLRILSVPDASLADLLSDIALGLFNHTSIYFFKEPLRNMAKQQLPIDHENVQEYLKHIKEMSTLSLVMSHGRKMWSPQSGKGSQNNEHDVYYLLNKSTTKIMDAREKLFREENIVEEKDEEGYYPYMREHNAKLDKGKK